MVVGLEIVGGVAGLSVTALRLVPVDSSPSLGLIFKDFFGVQLLIQVSNVAIIVLKVYDSFECFSLGSSLIEVVIYSLSVVLGLYLLVNALYCPDRW